MQKKLLEIKDLDKTYKSREGQVHALKDMQMEVERGEIVGILGPNGAGKTTTVKLIMGLTKPSKGELVFQGKRLEPNHIRSKIGYLPENFRPNPNLTVYEYIAMHCLLANGSQGAKSQAGELLKLVGMDGFAARKISNLSKGMGQRVGLAQAFSGDPDFLILDEPTSGLDPIGKSEVIQFLLQMKERGKTILFCSHILSEVEKLCDRIGIMLDGELGFVGSVPEFLQKWNVDDLEKGFKLEAQ
jgi:ABC-2 type transport system ATP-binding protein